MEKCGERLRTCPEHVVPIVRRGAQALDGWMQADQGAGQGVAGGVGIEPAVKLAPLVQQALQPGWVRPSPGCREATVSGMEGQATDGVNGRFAQDDAGEGRGGNGEAAQVFLGTRSQAAPSRAAGAAQFGADGVVILVAEEKDGIGAGIGIEGARGDERLQQFGGQAALADEVIFDAGEVAGDRGGKSQSARGRVGRRLGWQGRWKVARQPVQCRLEVQTL